MAKQNLQSLVNRAIDTLAPMFGLSDPFVRVIEKRPLDPAYSAQFFLRDRAIYICPRVFSQGCSEDQMHTVGEETGHAIDFINRPELFYALEAAQGSAEPEEFARIITSVSKTSNLLELTGYYCGLKFLEETHGKAAADKLSQAIGQHLSGFQLSEFSSSVQMHLRTCENMSLIAERAGGLEAASSHPVLGKIVMASRQQYASLTNHFGYLLASKMWLLPEERKTELFKLSLEAKDIFEFAEKAKIE